jgi:diacylglycerol kinase (ATP)
VLRRPARGPHVRYARFHTLRLESNGEVPVQVDGEVIGTLPMTFSIAPHALTVIVPEQAPAALFQRTPLFTTSLEATPR